MRDFMAKFKILFFILPFLSCVSFGSFADEKPEREYEYPETVRIVSLVNDAVKFLEANGELAFFEFNKKDSKWFSGDVYIEVFDINGIRYVDPSDLSRMGRDEKSLTDAIGKKFVQWIIADLQSPGRDHTWAHYMWTKPGATTPSWKSSYFKKAYTHSGRIYIVGTGLYDIRTEKAFILDTLDLAIADSKTKGTQCFNDFRNKQSRFYFRDVYIFVMSEDGVHLADPIFTNMEGQNTINLKDIKGDFFVQKFIKEALYDKYTWIEHIYPYPDTRVPTRKRSCVKKINIDNIPYIIGSGQYLQ